MSRLSDTRVQLVELLELDPPVAPIVYDHVPEAPQAPCVVVQAADNFVQLDEEDTFAGDLVVSWDVILLVELDEENDNEQASAQIVDSLDKLLDRLDGASWWLGSVNQPGGLVTTYWTHHGVRATVCTRI